jgi:hypothetical protein
MGSEYHFKFNLSFNKPNKNYCFNSFLAASSVTFNTYLNFQNNKTINKDIPHSSKPKQISQSSKPKPKPQSSKLNNKKPELVH